MSDLPPLTLEWNEEIFLKGAKLAYDFDMRNSWRRYVGWGFIALTQFGVVGAFRYGAMGLLLISTFLVVYWYFLRWPLRKRVLLRFFRKSQPSEKKVLLKTEDGGLCIDDKCVPWHEFRRVIAATEGYLLDMGDAFLFVPRKIFPNSESRNSFVALLKEKIERYNTFEI